jgi:hypothetical protein
MFLSRCLNILCELTSIKSDHLPARNEFGGHTRSFNQVLKNPSDPKLERNAFDFNRNSNQVRQNPGMMKQV